jgi:hypothetical protein
VLEYARTGTIRGLSGPDGGAMVESGVSRFKNQIAQTDEPLAILGLVVFVEQKKLSHAEYLGLVLNASYAPIVEAFGAYVPKTIRSDQVERV